MEEILHQLNGVVSHSNPIIYSVSWVPNVYGSSQLVQDFFHPQYNYHLDLAEPAEHPWYTGAQISGMLARIGACQKQWRFEMSKIMGTLC